MKKKIFDIAIFLVDKYGIDCDLEVNNGNPTFVFKSGSKCDISLHSDGTISSRYVKSVKVDLDNQQVVLLEMAKLYRRNMLPHEGGYYSWLQFMDDYGE